MQGGLVAARGRSPLFAIDPAEYEQTDAAEVAQIAVRFCGSIVAFAHVRAEQSYTLGEVPECSFICSGEALGGASVFPLFDDGWFAFSQEMSGSLHDGDARLDLSELRASGRARSRGAYFVAKLPAGGRVQLQQGRVEFELRAVPPGRCVARHAGIDRRFWFYNAVAAVLLGTLLMLSMSIPRSPLVVDFERDQAQPGFVGYMHHPLEERAREAGVSVRGEAETRQSRSAVAIAKRTTSASQLYQTGPRSALPAMRRGYDPEVAARHAGILGSMQQSGGNLLASPFGLTTTDHLDANLWESTQAEPGSSFGQLGDAFVRTGRGSCCGDFETIGLSIGTLGLAAGQRARGRAPHDEEAFGSRKARRPSVRCGCKVEIRGGRSGKIIRRVVRTHEPEVRHCYNEGLRRDPSLSGRVEVSFLIGSDGKVRRASTTKNGTGDPKVATCVAGAFRRWSFPAAAESSIVTYPYVFRVD